MIGDKKVIFSGIQPTELPTLGNYLGALKNWVKLQDEYNCLYCVVDMHSITVRQEPVLLRKRARELLTLLVAVGLDPQKNIIYYQSHVSEHAGLAWVLNCFTYMGELARMTQYKDKAKKHVENINAGLFTYPALMAADILLYQTDLVPVGEDQRQHLELCRDIAIRFNNVHGDVFTVPEPYIAKTGCKIMSLQEPEKKMSKSEDINNNNVIFVLDEPGAIRNKIKRAVTDSDNEVRYSKEKPGISNLLEIYCTITGKTVAEAEKEFSGVSYGEFKTAVGDTLVCELEPIQRRFKELSADKAFIDNVIKESAERASAIAGRTLKKVYKKVGFPL